MELVLWYDKEGRPHHDREVCPCDDCRLVRSVPRIVGSGGLENDPWPITIPRNAYER